MFAETLRFAARRTLTGLVYTRPKALSTTVLLSNPLKGQTRIDIVLPDRPKLHQGSITAGCVVAAGRGPAGGD